MTREEKIIQWLKILMMAGFLIVLFWFLSTGGIPCRIVG